MKVLRITSKAQVIDVTRLQLFLKFAIPGDIRIWPAYYHVELRWFRIGGREYPIYSDRADIEVDYVKQLIHDNDNLYWRAVTCA